MRAVFLVLGLCVVACGMATRPARAADSGLPFEVVQEDTDLEVAPDGRSWSVTELRARALTAQGVRALQQRTLSYTAGYQTLTVKAYTLKADGRRIEVPESDMLQGHGETTSPGFQDTRTITVVFPNLEVGDQVVTVTSETQLVPWFPHVVAAMHIFPREVVVRQARFALTTRGDDTAYHIVASGVQAQSSVTLGGKTRRTWTFHNDTPRKPESGEVAEYADQPGIEVSNLANYGEVAHIYADLFSDRTEVTPEISALANRLTAGIKSRRDQAKALYDWVTAHIEYVNIVLGAGGFRPNKAADVLKNGHGDCKDHVILLQALLQAKGIQSSAVLIRIGANQFLLPEVASPFLFDHLISYIPELKLYLDSTARYAPFGILPSSDRGKTVVLVQTGAVAVTPPDTVQSMVSADTVVTLNRDGSADGDVHIRATGTNGITFRGFLAELSPDNDSEFFRAVLGPGSDGKLQRGTPDSLESAYEYSAHYHQGHAAVFAGTGALSPFIGYHPIYYSTLFAGDLPPERTLDYVCATGTYRDDIQLTLPEGVSLTAVPPARSLSTKGISLHLDFHQESPSKVHVEAELKLDRSGPVCRAADYAQIRPVLSDMLDAMQVQLLYARGDTK